MSRPISESLSLLSETLGNCKTNLKEKSIENVDNIKISDVDEKIAEIQAGGSNSKFATVTSFKVGGSENVGKSYTSMNYPNKNNPIEIQTDPRVYNLHLLYIEDIDTTNPTIENVPLTNNSQDRKKWTGTYTGNISFRDNHSYTLLILGRKSSGDSDSSFEILFSNYSVLYPE